MSDDNQQNITDEYIDSLLRLALEKRYITEGSKYNQDDLREAIDKVHHTEGEKLFNAWIEEAPKQTQEKWEAETGFEERLFDRWREPLLLLDLLLIKSFEYGSELNREYQQTAADENDVMFDVLCRLHANACLISEEVICLLKGGFADGAMARWRTLHETAVISSFIAKHRREAAERYIAYANVETFKEAESYQQHCTKLGFESIAPEELRNIEKSVNQLKGQYGSDFAKPYGWAKPFIKKRGNVTIRDLENDVLMDHNRPYYIMACNYIHAGYKGLSFKIALLDEFHDNELLLAGPSNYGLADPGQCTAMSLNIITANYFIHKPSLERIAALLALYKLVERIANSFVETQKQIEREEQEVIDNDPGE